MSFKGLQERLSELQQTTSQLQELIDRLSNLKFQPGSVPLSVDDDDNVAAELSAEISQILGEEEEDLELLQEEILDVRSGRPGSQAEHDKTRLKEGAARLEAELKSCRISFRKAQLTARRSLEAARREEKQLLLAPYSMPPTSSRASGTSSPGPDPEKKAQSPQQQLNLRHRRRRDEDRQRSSQSATVSASTDVTAALRQTHTLIVSEVSRSEFAQQTLAESTAALGELGERYTDLGSMLKASRQLLGSLLRANKSDTWYLETAFWMLVVTAGWIVYRRLLYGPLWLLVWWPARLVLGTTWKIGTAVGGLGGGRGDAQSMVVVDGGDGARVVGMTEGAVPTARVGGESTQASSSGDDPDSMMEKVGRIIDGEQQGQEEPGEQEASEANSSGEDKANPKKMREENKKADDSRAKDEL